MLQDNHGCYTPDYAAAIDTAEEVLADELGISLAQAKAVLELFEAGAMERLGLMFGRTIGWLLQGKGKNMEVRIYALAFASGLDQLNGLPSQSEIARQLNVTRALISHYVVSAKDAIGIDVQKFRKSDRTRKRFRNAQLNSLCHIP